MGISMGPMRLETQLEMLFGQLKSRASPQNGFKKLHVPICYHH